jgi:hypothetical protein
MQVRSVAKRVYSTVLTQNSDVPLVEYQEKKKRSEKQAITVPAFAYRICNFLTYIGVTSHWMCTTHLLHYYSILHNSSFFCRVFHQAELFFCVWVIMIACCTAEGGVLSKYRTRACLTAGRLSTLSYAAPY